MEIHVLGLLIVVFFLVAGLLFGLFIAAVVARRLRAWRLQELQPPDRGNAPTPVSRDWIARPLRERQVAGPAPRTCPECGTVLSSDCPEGLCPKCLLRFGLPESEVQPVEGQQVRATPHEGLFT